MANGDEIKWHNENMPDWPDGMKQRHKVMCLLGYHLPETRVSPPKPQRNYAMKLRDQCGRCHKLL